MSAVSIGAALEPADVEAVKALFLEYARSLNFNLCFQGFDDEIATFPLMYAPPAGTLLLARVDGAAAGAVGLRPLKGESDACEMKRLFVRSAFRGLGLGRKLAEAVIADAARRGYRTMRLDTLTSMHEAGALYATLGFAPCHAYYENPSSEARYFARALNEAVSNRS